MAACIGFGMAGMAALLFVPGNAAYLGLYSVVITTAIVVVRSVRRQRPAAGWAWVCMGAAAVTVGLGTLAAGLVEPAMATQPNWFLLPGLIWIGSYILLIVGEAGIVTRHWGGRPDRAILVDGLVVSIAFMVPTATLASAVYASTPGPFVVRATTALYMLLDGVVGVMLAQLLLNGHRRHPAIWLVIVGSGLPVVADFAAVILRASVDPRYLGLGWGIGYILLQVGVLHPGLSRATEPVASKGVRLDGVRIAILAVALFTVPMTLVLGVDHAGFLATVGLLAASAAVSVLVLLRLTWLFRDGERARRAVEARERYFRALVQNIGDVIVVAGADGAVQYRSPSAGRLLGVPAAVAPDELVVDLVRGDDRAVAARLFDQALASPGELVSGEVRATQADGTSLWLDVTLHNLVADPAVGSVVIACRDVTERHLLEDQLRQEARHDALTGLPNRVLAFERLDRLITRASGTGSFVGVMFADLDNFKNVNDSLGHGAGDELLCSVAERLVAAVRPQDTVARLGGDEFVVLAEMSDATGFETLARRVVDSLSEPVDIAGREVLVTVSVGLAVGASGEEGEEVLRKADVALYRAKHAGRNAYAVYRDSDDADTGGAEPAADIDLAADLRRALQSEDQLAVYFQPVVELATGRVSGVEALVRWNHPDRGLLLPAAFIPMAEENGLIVPLGRWVLGEACRQVASSGIDDLEVAVNISARQLEDDTLHEVISEALRHSGLEPHRLILELTESVLLRDDSVVTRMEALKEIGLQLAVDDFGTGYSSLAYLQRFPVDTLKVDRQFLAAVATDESAAALVRGVVELAHTVGLRTVAEGVENQAQAQVLKASGCEWAQGFMFARPAPFEDIVGLLEERGLLTAARPAGDDPAVVAKRRTRSGARRVTSDRR